MPADRPSTPSESDEKLTITLPGKRKFPSRPAEPEPDEGVVGGSNHDDLEQIPSDEPTTVIGKKYRKRRKRRFTSRSLEPEGVVVGGNRDHDDLRHQPEQKILPPDEPIIVTGEKIKIHLRRTVDKKKKQPSKSADLSTTTIKTERETASDLYYSCNIDKVSEAQIAEAVQSINYSIDNLISNILDGVKKSTGKLELVHSSYHHHHKPSSRLGKHNIPTTKPDSSDSDIMGTCSIALWSMLMDFRLSRHKRELVVDAVLHNLISSLLHKHFFKGGPHFFGVGSETLHGNLETMLSKLVANENADPIAIQRWRSMSVEAVFQMNGGIESQLNDQLITELERMLKIAFPLTRAQGTPTRSSNKLKQLESSSYQAIIRGERQSLLDIILEARKLSFTIQHEIVSCQLLVTIAPTTSTTNTGDDALAKCRDSGKKCVSRAWEEEEMGPQDDDALGTYAFGLQRILNSERSILIQPKMITRELLTI